MDLATLVGIVLGLVMVVFGIISSADISAITKSFLDLPSFIITFGGSIAGMIGSYTFKELITVLKVLRLHLRILNLIMEDLLERLLNFPMLPEKKDCLHWKKLQVILMMSL